VIAGSSGAIRCASTTKLCHGSTQQQETQPVETISEARLGTTKTGKPLRRMQWNEEINKFIMRQYYIITKLKTIKIEYRQELHDRFMGQYSENKYQELANAICVMCKQKAGQVIRIVITSTGVIPKSLSQSLKGL
jgi:hypothetical protein